MSLGRTNSVMMTVESFAGFGASLFVIGLLTVPQNVPECEVGAQAIMSVRTFIGLILCNLAWSAHPAMSKILLEHLTPVHAAWLRYSSGLLTYFVLIALLKVFLPKNAELRMKVRQPFFKPKTAIVWAQVIGLGFATFCFSPLFQLTGLSTTRSIDNALIIALEPLMTVFLAWVFLKESLNRVHFLSFALAVSGFAFLSELATHHSLSSSLIGNLMMLTALIGEAVYSVVGRKLIARHPPIAVFGTALLIGVLCLTIFTGITAGFPDISKIGFSGLIATLWLGPLGTCATYLFWMTALVEAPVASLTITIFIQPLMGTVWGYTFLHERLNMTQAFGGVLILTAVLFDFVAQTRAKRAMSPLNPQIV